MSTVAQVTDGVVTSGINEALTAEKTTGSGSALGKDAFLQLLVAEMENQDPLNSQDNSTEYIAQLATFSELESMQNLQSTAENMNYQSMLGKTVTMDVEGNMITGQVDDIVIQSTGTKFKIDGEYYDADKLYQVYDSDYLAAYTKASNIIKVMKELPKNPYEATKEQMDSFGTIASSYVKMSDYEKSYLTDEVKAQMDAYVKEYERQKGESLDPQKAMVEKITKESQKTQDLLTQMLAAQSATGKAVTDSGAEATKAIKDLQDALTKLENEVAAAGASGNANSSSEDEEDEVTEEMLDAILGTSQTE
ncbi:MAG: hypothetical protein KBS85_02870 [Lachnospiraceae bacterium]|nr:hypothetical protein [Candidatus Merdinaster equi]